MRNHRNQRQTYFSKEQQIPLWLIEFGSRDYQGTPADRFIVRSLHGVPFSPLKLFRRLFCVWDPNPCTGLEGRSFTRDIDGVTPVLTPDFPGFRSRGIGSVGKPQPSPGLHSEITFPKWESPMSPSCGAFVTQNFHFSQDKSVILKRAAKRADYTRYSKDPKNWIAV